MKQTFQFLLAEDNEDHAELIIQSFSPRGKSRVTHVPSGEAVLGYLENCGTDGGPPRPCAILLDLNLPGLTGIEVLQWVKQHPDFHSIPTIILTTSRADRDRTLAYANHANSYVTKPVDFQSLQETIRSVEEYWTTTNQPPTERLQ